MLMSSILLYACRFLKESCFFLIKIFLDIKTSLIVQILGWEIKNIVVIFGRLFNTTLKVIRIYGLPLIIYLIKLTNFYHSNLSFEIFVLPYFLIYITIKTANNHFKYQKITFVTFLENACIRFFNMLYSACIKIIQVKTTINFN